MQLDHKEIGNKYGIIAAQRHEHEEFSRDADGFKKRLRQDGATNDVAIEVTGKLLRWLIKHIRRHDKELVEYIKEYIALRKKYEN